MGQKLGVSCVQYVQNVLDGVCPCPMDKHKVQPLRGSLSVYLSETKHEKNNRRVEKFPKRDESVGKGTLRDLRLPHKWTATTQKTYDKRNLRKNRKIEPTTRELPRLAGIARCNTNQSIQADQTTLVRRAMPLVEPRRAIRCGEFIFRRDRKRPS